MLKSDKSPARISTLAAPYWSMRGRREVVVREMRRREWEEERSVRAVARPMPGGVLVVGFGFVWFGRRGCGCRDGVL